MKIKLFAFVICFFLVEKVFAQETIIEIQTISPHSGGTPLRISGYEVKNPQGSAAIFNSGQTEYSLLGNKIYKNLYHADYGKGKPSKEIYEDIIPFDTSSHINKKTNTIEKNYHAVIKDTEIDELSLFDLHCKKVTFELLNRGPGYVDINNSNIQSFSLNGSAYQKFDFGPFINHSNIGLLYYNHIELGKSLSLGSSRFRKIHLSDCQISSSIAFKGLELPDTIVFQDIHFNENDSFINLIDIQNPKGKLCKLQFLDCDISRFKLDYMKFNLDLSARTNEEKKTTYKQLLEEQKRDGFDEGYKKLATEYASFKYLSNPNSNKLAGNFSKWWWNYGLNPEYLITNSIILFLLFSLINFCVYEELLENGYTVKIFVEKFKDVQKRYDRKWSLTRIAQNYFYCLIYSGNLFWGLKVDLDKIKLRSVLLVFWIYFQYIVGLLCITFIIHYYFIEKHVV